MFFAQFAQKIISFGRLTPFLSFIYKTREPSERIEPSLSVHFSPGDSNGPENRCPIGLLPGGRFLVYAKSITLSIWDLGYPSERYSLSDPILVATIATEECHDFFLKPTADALGVQVFIISDPANNVSVFEIHPTSSNPSFHKVASLDIAIHAWQDHYCLCGDRLFIIFGNVVTVWDFSQNLWANWEIGKQPSYVSATDNYVIFVENDDQPRLGLWRIPPLRSIGSTPASLGVLSADIWFTLPGDVPVEYYGGLDEWYLTGGIGQTRCIIDGYVSGAPYHRTSAFFRVELPLTLSVNEEINSADNDDLDINFFDLPTPEIIQGSLRICNENTISAWTSQSGLQFHATRRTNIVNRPYTPLDLTPSPRSASVQINIPQTHDITAFCPVSGRLCYLLHGHADNRIYIADCLFRNPSKG